MTAGHRWAIATALMATGAIMWGVADPGVSAPLMIIGALLPAAIALAVWGSVGGRVPGAAAMGGAVVGALAAVASHALVLAFAYVFFLGFAERAVDVLHAIRVDPQITDILNSPWTLLVMVELVVVAPLTEEFGKGLGARLANPASRRQAFMFGVAAGAGFAVIENILYASGAAWFGEPWTALLVGRALGVAVHPLATGLVVLGWWQWRNNAGPGSPIRLIVAGVGVHAMWNGSLVALSVADGAYQLSETSAAASAVALAYSAVFGAAVTAWLWRMTVTIRSGDETVLPTDLTTSRGVGSWLILGAAVLVPVAVLVLTFPTIF